MALQYFSTVEPDDKLPQLVLVSVLVPQQRIAVIVPVVEFSVITVFKAYLSLLALRVAVTTKVEPAAPLGAPMVMMKFLPP